MGLNAWYSYSSLAIGIALLAASATLGAGPGFSPAPGLGALLVLTGIIWLVSKRSGPPVEAAAGLLAGLASLLSPPLQGPGAAAAALGATAAGLLLVASALGSGRLKAVLVGVILPLLVFLGLPMYPEWSGASMILLAVAGPALTIWGPGTAGLAMAAYSGIYGPIPALAAAAGALLALAVDRQKLPIGLPALLLAVSVPALPYYQPAGPVIAVAGGLAAVWLLGERRPEILAAAISPGALLYLGGLYGGLARQAASGLFMAGALLGLSILLLSRGSRSRQAVLASALLILALSAPLFVPPSKSSANVEISSFSYNTSKDGFELEPSSTSTGQSIRGYLEGLEGPDRVAALLLLDPEMPARVIAPGIVENVTVRDLAANTTLSISPEEPSFLLTPLNSTMTLLFAADPEGPLLRAALRAPWIIIPLQLTGGTLPSPVHTVITVNFSEPMILQLPGGGRLEVRTAVIASSFVAGGPRSEAEELPIGARWTNVAIGVAKGSVEYKLGSVAIPYNITGKHLEIFNSILEERRANPESAALKGLEALYELEQREGSPQAIAPEKITVKAGTSEGVSSLELVHTGSGYARVYGPLTTLSGADTIAIIPRPGTLGLAGYNASYSCALASSFAYNSGGDANSVVRAAQLVGCDAPASAAWLGVHAVSPGLAEPPAPGLDAYKRPLGAIALVAPFLAAIGAALELSVAPGGLAETPKLAPRTEP